ncbi:hypothetical protein L596_013646 [Steinernema carpocapsae]|uniref:Uncharacterized protein n=1 Tax=Steinernema carpocapsae TaxID=34508 RepID=A0A4U5P1N0_STECR|nr:hypothetical protein L596_013646 [Steinernema carpocapsae]
MWVRVGDLHLRIVAFFFLERANRTASRGTHLFELLRALIVDVVARSFHLREPFVLEVLQADRFRFAVFGVIEVAALPRHLKHSGETAGDVLFRSSCVFVLC